MGDRANIAIKQRSGDNWIYLYAHWDGSILPVTLQHALRRGRDRWDDMPYLTRIIFCEMVASELMETTGFGISADLTDGDDRVLEVDCESETVRLREKGNPIKFADYLEIPFIKYENKWAAVGQR